VLLKIQRLILTQSCVPNIQRAISMILQRKPQAFVSMLQSRKPPCRVAIPAHVTLVMLSRNCRSSPSLRTKVTSPPPLLLSRWENSQAISSAPSPPHTQRISSTPTHTPLSALSILELPNLPLSLLPKPILLPLQRKSMNLAASTTNQHPFHTFRCSSIPAPFGQHDHNTLC